MSGHGQGGAHTNEALVPAGVERAGRPPGPGPFGHGNERFFRAFLVAPVAATGIILSREWPAARRVYMEPA